MRTAATGQSSRRELVRDGGDPEALPIGSGHLPEVDPNDPLDVWGGWP